MKPTMHLSRFEDSAEPTSPVSPVRSVQRAARRVAVCDGEAASRVAESLRRGDWLVAQFQAWQQRGQ
jgi:hypothetical protein